MSGRLDMLGAPRQSPRHVGHYELIRRIGAGAMAEVYEVEHRRLGRRYALKILRPEQAQKARVVERFEQEARTLAGLRSPHIVDVVDAGASEEGIPYFVMELLEGSDLRTLLSREGPLPARRAVYAALELCAALDVAHRAGVVHRDLKPENVFVCRDADGRDLCKLLDFGVAKSPALDITRDDALIGTARYMAPEQFSGDGSVGPTTDLFALGVILFECLAGVPPFDGDSMERILFNILNEPAPSLASLRPELPAALVTLVARMLERNHALRPAGARELAAALRAIIEPRYTEAGAETLCAEPLLAPVEGSLLRAHASDPVAKPRSAAFRTTLRMALALAVGIGVGMRGAERAPAEPVARPVTPHVAHDETPRVAAPVAEPLRAREPARTETPPPAELPKKKSARAAQAAPVPAPQAERPPLFFPSASP